MISNKVYFNRQTVAQFEIAFGSIAFVCLCWFWYSSSDSLSISTADQTPPVIEHVDQQTQIPKRSAKTQQLSSIPPLNERQFYDLSYVVVTGDSLETIFKKHQLPITELLEILEADEPYLFLDVLRPGDQLRFRVDKASNRLDAFSRVLDPSKTVSYRRSDDGFVYDEIVIPTSKVAEVTRGKVFGSFYVSASSSGLSDNSVMTITQLLRSSLNFNRDLRAGDHFQVVMERETIDGRTIGKDRLLAARIYSRGKEYGAYLHSDGSYYDSNGSSLVPALLRYPTRQKFRISSHFSPRRRHPVTGLFKPHHGVDFAMPTGTPVLSTGHGRVTRIANHPYAGKYIDIDQFGSYSTRFLHLSKILVTKGQRVQRGQVIALSGNTGRSTGPHLHYELHVKGRPVNPITASIPMLKSIPDSEINSFRLRVADMQKLMISDESIVQLDSPVTNESQTDQPPDQS